ncbi:MAG: hypothetical protein VW987_07330, partial [Alphaproteobacteria bacterium]
LPLSYTPHFLRTRPASNNALYLHQHPFLCKSFLGTRSQTGDIFRPTCAANAIAAEPWNKIPAKADTNYRSLCLSIVAIKISVLGFHT